LPVFGPLITERALALSVSCQRSSIRTMTKPTRTDLEDRAADLIRAAHEHGLTLATAESCTGGRLANLLADAPGAGVSFHGGFVVYTKENKSKALGVPAALIEKHSAVSAEVAKAMALGALERSPADVVVSITGVAGPEPDEDGNPVGLVYLAAARRGGQLRNEEHRFGDGSKNEICHAAEECAIELLKKVILQKQ
jgi:nicotinamide-nucleotide amidase